MISAIILSAGLSSRFGSPKALAMIQSEVNIVRLQRVLLASQVSEIIIVLGAESNKIKPYLLNHTKIKYVYNKDYILGQTSSFQAGLNEVCPETQGLMLLPVDYPLIKTVTIDLLIQEFLKDVTKIVIPLYATKKGHPPIFPYQLKQEFMTLRPDQGLHEIIRCDHQRVQLIDVADQSVIQAFNTLKELRDLIANNTP